MLEFSSGRCSPKHLHYSQVLESHGVVTYMSPIEAFVTRIKIFDRQKVCLIAWLALLRPLIAWFFMGQRSNCSHAFLILWFLPFRGHLDSLVGSQKGFWSLDSILIPVANTYTQDIKVTTPWMVNIYCVERPKGHESSLIPSLSPQKQGESLGMKLRDIIIH